MAEAVKFQNFRDLGDLVIGVCQQLRRVGKLLLSLILDDGHTGVFLEFFDQRTLCHRVFAVNILDLGGQIGIVIQLCDQIHNVVVLRLAGADLIVQHQQRNHIVQKKGYFLVFVLLTDQQVRQFVDIVIFHICQATADAAFSSKGITQKGVFFKKPVKKALLGKEAEVHALG